MKFEKYGSYWTYPMWKRMYLNILYWFKGFYLFIKCLLDYDTSIKGNEFTILDTWSLCFSIQEARMGKGYRWVDLKAEESKDA